MSPQWARGLLAAVLLAAVSAQAAPIEEERRIEYLIASIESLAGAQFVRNGTAYDAHAAADHLRMKRDKAGARVMTAADFIRDCASTSSVSGKPYLIRYADGREVTAQSFLRARLAAYGTTPVVKPMALQRLRDGARFATVRVLASSGTGTGRVDQPEWEATPWP
jgi:hypothetical protein